MVEGTLPARASPHPVSLGFTVYFDENVEDRVLFPSHQMKVPLNRYLGKGLHMYVVGVTLPELKALCGEGEEEMAGDGRATDDDGSDVSSSGEDDDEE
jgi:hypothetical protein